MVNRVCGKKLQTLFAYVGTGGDLSEAGIKKRFIFFHVDVPPLTYALSSSIIQIWEEEFKFLWIKKDLQNIFHLSFLCFHPHFFIKFLCRGISGPYV